MITGFDTALGEITLVLFTTLAPSGAVAFMLMAVARLLSGADEGACRRIDKFLCIPIIVSMVGLVASATHLGNPANALYVFTSVGRSPLSTEVFCAVLFLLFAGVYWLYSFRLRPSRALQRAWLAVSLPVGALFVTSIAFAYAADTILSWNTPYAPVTLWLNALTGGPLVAAVGLRAARWRAVEQRFGKVMIALAAAALAASGVVYVLQARSMGAMENAIVSAFDLVPTYWAMLAVFAVLAGVGVVLCARALRGEGCGGVAEVSLRAALTQPIVASALVLLGIFIMRFAFYMMHMTVGMSL